MASLLIRIGSLMGRRDIQTPFYPSQEGSFEPSAFSLQPLVRFSFSAAYYY